MMFVLLLISFWVGGFIGLLVGCVLSNRRINAIASREARLIERLRAVDGLSSIAPKELFESHPDTATIGASSQRYAHSSSV